ncbi:MAG: PEP-CTERM sorting domain-containing protein [Verrucomicrobiae bacterium]
MIFAACSLPLALRGSITYSITENISYFGWLDQYSLDNATYGFVGGQACIPTASTNAMTYLQNLAPGYFGTALTGTSYADWMAADATLVSASYMNTSSANGTYYNHIPYALNKYIIQDKGFAAVQFSGMLPSDYWDPAPYDKPSYMSNGSPTSEFLRTSLSANSAIVFSILYPGVNGGGHELLAGGLNWTDLNDDGIIQESENATLSFVDPLDPSATYPDGQPGGAAKFTQGHIWNAGDLSTGNLLLDYSQYAGKLPYSSGNYSATGAATIDTAFAISVPEPMTWILLAFGLAVVFCLRQKSLPQKGSEARQLQLGQVAVRRVIPKKK